MGAGYDLMELLHEDVLTHGDRYDIDPVDKNIDFRRVRNLKVYFKNTAIALTTDIHDIDQWQGGDIVILKSHRHCFGQAQRKGHRLRAAQRQSVPAVL